MPMLRRFRNNYRPFSYTAFALICMASSACGVLEKIESDMAETERQSFIARLKTKYGEQINAVCAKRNFSKGEAVGAGDLETKKINTADAPAFVIMSARKVGGHRAMRNISAGAPLSERDFDIKHEIVYAIKDIPEGSKISIEDLEVHEIDAD